MSEEHKHQLAINILRHEMCNIGGELFEKTFVEEVLNAQVNEGNKEAKKELEMVGFVNTLLGGSIIKDQKENDFQSLFKSILLLSSDKEGK